MKLKLLIGFVSGIGISIALVYLITDMYNNYMNWYNFGTFIMIFVVGVVLLNVIFSIVQKLKRRPINNEFLGRKTFTSLIIMNLVLIVFGFTFYDYSTPRDLSLGETYQNKYKIPSQLNDDWEISPLTKEGMDTLTYNKVINALVNDENYKRMHSILIAKNGKLVAEDYFYDYDKDKPHDLRSANKTITSILMGIAIDHGYIESTDLKVYDLFPEFHDIIDWGENKHTLTIKHLLTMNTGLDCNDWSSSSLGNENKLYRTDDWIKAFFQLPYKEPSGTQFSYCTFGEILCRVIIARESGLSLQEFAKKYLFDPLQISNYKWTMIMPDRDNIGIRISLTPRDFAKLGQLFLNNGYWNSKQIVSKKWVEISTNAHTVTTEKRLGYPKYGYLWWKNTFEVNNKVVNGYQALGNGGQLLFVFPDLDMVVVFTAGNYGNPRMINGFKIMKEDILPSVLINKPYIKPGVIK